MSDKIGYQDGITAFLNWYRKQPGVPQRGPNYNPGDISTWPWVDKLERTLRILKDDHDAAIATTPPPPPPPLPPNELAPQTYNRGSRGQDAKYCTDGLPQENGAFVDGGGFRYDDQGLCLGGRSGNPVAGLKPSDEMDGRGPCDPYTNGDQSFPPWPAASYEV